MARKVRMLVPHRAILINGETIEYEGAHPTHWTFGGVDKDGKMDGSPVQTVAVQAIIPGTWPEDDYESDPRDVEIERLRKIISELRSQHDPRDTQIVKLREQAQSLLNQKKVTEVELTPEEIRANEDALTEYKSGLPVENRVEDAVPEIDESLTVPPDQRALWEQFVAEHAKGAE